VVSRYRPEKRCEPRQPKFQRANHHLAGDRQRGLGSFDERSDAEPGFAWVGAAPPAGIFGSPVLQANGNQLTMSDLDNGAGTTGDGIYQLSATIGDVVYQPNKTSPTGTHTNPSIKNN
jgi:hypothetical protein